LQNFKVRQKRFWTLHAAMASFRASEHDRTLAVPQESRLRQLAQRVAESGETKDLNSFLDTGRKQHKPL
jgi:hypothetical protein